jgi:hypothetical protein
MGWGSLHMIFAVGSGFTLELQTEGVEPLIANEEV